MRKKDELVKGCMAKARDDEMTFVLLARDPAAPDAIRYWIGRRIALGKNKPDDLKMAEAAKCAATMQNEYLDSLEKKLSRKYMSKWSCFIRTPDDDSRRVLEIAGVGLERGDTNDVFRVIPPDDGGAFMIPEEPADLSSCLVVDSEGIPLLMISVTGKNARLLNRPLKDRNETGIFYHDPAVYYP